MPLAVRESGRQQPFKPGRLRTDRRKTHLRQQMINRAFARLPRMEKSATHRG